MESIYESGPEFIESLEAILLSSLSGHAVRAITLCQLDEKERWVVTPLFTMSVEQVCLPVRGVEDRWNTLAEIVNALKKRVKRKCTIFRFSDLTLIAQENTHWDVDFQYIPIVKDLCRRENKLWRLLGVAPNDQRAVESRPTIIQSEDDYGLVLRTPNEAELLKTMEPSRALEARYHLFLWISASLMFPGVYPRRYSFHPNIGVYQKWLEEFPGWTYGPMRPSHCAWKPEYANRQLLMNQFFPDTQDRACLTLL